MLIGGIVVVLCVVLAILASRSQKFSAFSFALWVIAFVATAMTFPQYLIRWGNTKLTDIVPYLIQIIMFGMGTTLALKDFARVAKMPKAAFVGTALQFIIMPGLAALLVILFGFKGALAAGIILIGASPGGVASNVITYLAGGNVALSVTLTAISTMLSPFLTPLAMKIFAGTYIEIDAIGMMKTILNMIILPIVAGFIANYFLQRYSKIRDRLLPIVSMTAICMVLAILTAASRDKLLTTSIMLGLVVIIHNTGGYILGYWGSRAVRLNEAEARTISVEVGMQNAGMAAGLAVSVLNSPEAGLAATVFATVMNVSGALLASYWRGRPVKTEPVAAETPAAVTAT